MKLKIHNVKGYDGLVTIKTDKNGLPLDKFWRDRLKDSQLDNCVEIVKTKSKTKQEKAQ